MSIYVIIDITNGYGNSPHPAFKPHNEEGNAEQHPGGIYPPGAARHNYKRHMHQSYGQDYFFVKRNGERCSSDVRSAI
jgi:hypothetical protein